MKKIFIITSLITSAVFAINLNTASIQELEKIKGIGPKKAKAIIEYRKTHKIKNADDLKNIKGFNSKVISNVKNNVTTQKHLKINNKKTAIKNKKEKKQTNNVNKTKKSNLKNKIQSKKNKLKTLKNKYKIK